MRCSKCILPGTTPGIALDEDGVCNYCKSYDLRFSNWEQVKEQKSNQFMKILEYSKKLKRSYDCLVPLSGGKDSTYVLYLLAEKFNMRCLSITFDHGFMSDQAKFNIKNATERTDSHHIYFSLPQEKTISMFRHFSRRPEIFVRPV
jgi:3'-phosphoadenosine 5'-phosphosulfate sulfotransferase (PAPS reductase)/FAD synthetase